jgi:hypothetical protein
MELKYKHSIKEKDLEIEKLTDEVFSLRSKYEILNTEYESYKIETQKELESRKELHRNEVRDLMSKCQILTDKCDNITEKEQNKTLKQEVEMYRKNYTDLQNEVLFLRREKDVLFCERNDVKLSLTRELEHERMKSASISSENEKLSQIVKINDNELSQLRDKIEDKNSENKILTNEKFNLLFELKEKEREFELFKAELKYFKQKVLEHERELEEQDKANNEAERDRLINEKKEREYNEKLIEDLRAQLRNYKIEGKILNESEYEKEGLVVSKEAELKMKLKAKIDEIANLNNIIKNLRDGGNVEKVKREYQSKIQELIRKKNHYKQQVKYFNRSVLYKTKKFKKYSRRLGITKPLNLNQMIRRE